MTPADTSSAPETRPIRVLSNLVASQIAAGEVVERPASVVKELAENAIDAGATRIQVELEQGGVELVRVTDNGGGIAKGDLTLAIAPHATSKVSSIDDLDHIATLGFRGEALASIASVSRLSIRSRTSASQEAFELVSEGDNVQPIRPTSGPVGTSVSVRNLFFNTPARRKFLRTISTEQGRCHDTLLAIAMAHPLIGVRLVIDGKVVFDLPPDQTPQQRILDLIGKELEPELLIVQSDQHDVRGVSLFGLVGTPSIARATNKSQHIFVNGRPVRDRTVQHALLQAYRGLIEPSRYPTAVLMLEMSPEAVDVNVHPTKAEVRFRDSSLVHSVVYHAVSRALRAADLTPTYFSLGGSAPTHPTAVLPATPEPSAIEPRTPPSPQQMEAFVGFLQRFDPSTPQPMLSTTEGAALPPVEGQTPTGVSVGSSEIATPSTPVGSALPEVRRADRILQVHNSYVVTQDAQGVVIVDQHALHERVMFEALLARVGAGNLESQQLLSPEIVEATADQLGRLEEMKSLLTRVGIEAEPAGPRSIAIRAFPSFLFSRNVEPGPFIADLLALTDDNEEASRDTRLKAGDTGPRDERLLRDVLDMMACKAAIKAGDAMSDLELNELMRLREAVERSSNCPHGRPTTVRLTIRELDKLFGRG
ncbi:MAG TPA: DNA mismatch repair endonuclease MutL [Phycisphaerales bacterium]